MPTTLDTTLAGTEANSYCDLAFANDYWANHYSSTKSQSWSQLLDNQKNQVLVHATSIIETARYTTYVPVSEYNLHYDRLTQQVLDITMSRDAVRYYYFQKLQFPRNLDFDPILNSLYIPDPVKRAECEQAMYILTFDETALANRLQGIVSDTLSIGKNQIHLTQQYVQQGSMFSPVALEFVRPFFVRSTKQKRS